MTQGEAYTWARRFRKVGFTPVTLHYDTDGAASGELVGGGYYLICNWPYDLADLPDDLYPFFAFKDYHEVGGVYEDWSVVHLVGNRYAAHRLLAQFRMVRLGMGSRPLPTVNTAPREPKLVTTGRIMADYDDWPLATQRHPDYVP